ncbi:MAG TPA: addiction module protein [Pyrinomonadaceae bacterium]|nr:addiction module protein [Pyrinomonadaceae bacterium]
MSVEFEDIKRQTRSLTVKQKAALARLLIEQLDQTVDKDTERLWIEEAQRRYEAYLRGELTALPGDEVMDRIRERLR